MMQREARLMFQLDREAIRACELVVAAERELWLRSPTPEQARFLAVAEERLASMVYLAHRDMADRLTAPPRLRVLQGGRR